MSSELVEFTKLPNGNLKLSLTRAGQDACVESQEQTGELPCLGDLIEEQLCNGWEWVWPDEVGALTDAPMLSDECVRDEQTGELLECPVLYWFPEYEVFDPVARMLANGEVIFTRSVEE